MANGYRRLLKITLKIILLTVVSWSLLIGLLIIVAFSAASWFLSPKGENQTYVGPMLYVYWLYHIGPWNDYYEERSIGPPGRDVYYDYEAHRRGRQRTRSADK
jgi:hypothetical protein